LLQFIPDCSIVEITPPALKNISWRFYIIFGIFNAIIAPTIYFFFVETKGKSLEEIGKAASLRNRAILT
jgi:hypothetical protein